MIASVRGRLLATDREGVVLDVGGIGLRIQATSAAVAVAEAHPAEAALHTYLAVREDALSLYGFASVEERELFVALLGVNGVGPKAALAILSAYAPPRLRLAIAAEDAELFTSVPGIGRKIAGRIVIELKERVAALGATASGRDVPTPAADGELTAARDALVGLGFSVAEAESALTATTGEAEERVRQALGALRAPA